MVMAPHYSTMSIGASLSAPRRPSPVSSWRRSIAGTSAPAISPRSIALPTRWRSSGEARRDVPIIFTAHSLPGALEHGDPYPDELLATVDAPSREPRDRNALCLPERGDDRRSVAGTGRRRGDREVARRGKTNILICPIGFVCEHVEILFDIDIEYQELAEKLGVHPSDRDAQRPSPVLAGLAQVARSASDAGWLRRSTIVAPTQGRPFTGTTMGNTSSSSAAASAAWRRHRADAHPGTAVTLVEREDRLGGKILTVDAGEVP